MKTLSSSRTKEEIAQLIDQWRLSRKTKKDFCLERNIKYLTFIDWTCKQGERRGPNKSQKTTGFIPVSIPEPEQKLFAEIHFCNGHRMVFHQPVPAEYRIHPVYHIFPL